MCLPISDAVVNESDAVPSERRGTITFAFDTDVDRPVRGQPVITIPCVPANVSWDPLYAVMNEAQAVETNEIWFCDLIATYLVNVIKCLTQEQNMFPIAIKCHSYLFSLCLSLSLIVISSAAKLGVTGSFPGCGNRISMEVKYKKCSCAKI